MDMVMIMVMIFGRPGLDDGCSCDTVDRSMKFFGNASWVNYIYAVDLVNL
jgi:hypothetical protein